MPGSGDEETTRPLISDHGTWLRRLPAVLCHRHLGADLLPELREARFRLTAFLGSSRRLTSQREGRSFDLAEDHHAFGKSKLIP
jgi:hypothetical protein